MYIHIYVLREIVCEHPFRGLGFGGIHVYLYLCINAYLHMCMYILEVLWGTVCQHPIREWGICEISGNIDRNINTDRQAQRQTCRRVDRQTDR